MAIFNIPQFIDTEDKIAGPFTAKQLGWTIAAAAVIFLAYLFFGKTAAIIMAVPTLLIFGALAFYKPNGQPLTFIAGSIVNFFFHPKLYVWRRLPDENAGQQKKVSVKREETPQRKILTREKIGEITELLDAQKNPLEDLPASTRGDRLSTRSGPKITYGNITFK
jgi:hypothetical protein